MWQLPCKQRTRSVNRVAVLFDVNGTEIQTLKVWESLHEKLVLKEDRPMRVAFPV